MSGAVKELTAPLFLYLVLYRLEDAVKAMVYKKARSIAGLLALFLIANPCFGIEKHSVYQSIRYR